jgi:hypothetical protein
VGVATDLRHQAGVRQGRQVSRHERRGSAKKYERRSRHSRPLDGYQRWNTPVLRLQQQIDDVKRALSWVPVGLVDAPDFVAADSAPLAPFFPRYHPGLTLSHVVEQAAS